MSRKAIYSLVGVVVLMGLVGVLLLGTNSLSLVTSANGTKKLERSTTTAKAPEANATMPSATTARGTSAKTAIRKSKGHKGHPTTKQKPTKERITAGSKKPGPKLGGQEMTVDRNASEQQAAAEAARQQYAAQQYAVQQKAAERAAKEQAATAQAARQQALAQQALAQQAVTTQATTTVSQPEQTTTASTTGQATTTNSAPATPSGTDLYLTVPKLGISGSYVANTSDPSALDNGAIHLPQTGFPWQPGSNTYIAGHVLGYRGTGSYLQFANLPNMVAGDMIYLSDSNGTTYTYRVFRTMIVSPYDTYVTAPVPGQTVVTLQTCVDPPAYDQRFIVQGDLLSTTTSS